MDLYVKSKVLSDAINLARKTKLKENFRSYTFLTEQNELIQRLGVIFTGLCAIKNKTAMTSMQFEKLHQKLPVKRIEL